VRIRTWKSLILDGRLVTICVYFDIADQVEREHLLSTQNWALSAYAGAALALGRAETVAELKQSICEAITRESEYALAWIGIAECNREKTVRIAAAAGSGIRYIDGLHLSWSEGDPTGGGPTGISIRSGEVKIMEDSEMDEFFAPWRERARQAGVRSSAAIPFSIDGKRRGALMVYSVHPNAFEPAAIEVFQHLAGQIGHGIHALEQAQLLRAEQTRLEKMQMQLSAALSAMVSPIVTAMEMRDPYTSGHQSRVAEIAVAIGKELGWDEERLQGLRVAGLVHDIGKISIPSEILTKPGRLTAVERELIQDHPDSGYTILKGIPFAWPVAEIVRQHHEKLDGSGYPFGLNENAILPEAKVLAVADIVEAMASDRPYRRAISLERVLTEIEEQSGSLLDAEVVRACARLFREGRLSLPTSEHE
jgi:putative nucleotidyltransferase with HDIG domain